MVDSTSGFYDNAARHVDSGSRQAADVREPVREVDVSIPKRVVMRLVPEFFKVERTGIAMDLVPQRCQTGEIDSLRREKEAIATFLQFEPVGRPHAQRVQHRGRKGHLPFCRDLIPILLPQAAPYAKRYVGKVEPSRR